MTNQLKLTATPRNSTGRQPAKRLRTSGIVPANIYSSKNPPANLQVNEREISNLLSHAAGENLLVNLQIAGENKNRLALIQEVQHEPISGRILHVDFHEVSMDETIQTEVNIEPIGEAAGVRNFGGLLEQLIRHITIECLPKDLPDVIHVDVTGLGLGQSLHVGDLPLPQGVRVVSDADLTVFLVSEPRVSEATSEGGPTQPEVLKEKKKDEGDEKK